MKALFICLDMHNGFHGSFLHVLEYGEYLKSKGYEVHIGSVFISDANRKIAEDLGFIVHRLDEVPLNTNWDLVYALHMVLFPALLAQGLKYDKAISMTLSAFGGIELVPPSALWPYFDLMTVISEEARNAYRNRFQLDPDIFTVIPNHVPLEFMKAKTKTVWNRNLKNVLVVSNHFVPEIFCLAKMAPFKVDIVGSEYGKITRVTAALLSRYDAVITIGKTVQYCMALGIPVFQYDKFGGCGYITIENLENEEKTNFSGRGTKKVLSPIEMISLLQSDYAKACVNAPQIMETARKRYDIAQLIDRQLAIVTSCNKMRPPLQKDGLLFAEGSGAVLKYLFAALSINGRALD